MNTTRSAALALLLCVLLSPGAAADDGPETAGGSVLASYLENFVAVPRDVFGGLYRDTLAGDPATLLGWGLVGGAFLLDESLRDKWQRDVRSSGGDDVAEIFNRSGNSDFIWAGLGLGLGSSLLFRNRELRYSSALALQSFVLAQGFSELAKRVSGRLRPRDSDGDADRWRDGGMSFFSGHASGAWSIAAVLAHRHRGSRLVPALAYGWAAGVSVSRINHDAHYLSDVLVGSLLGYLVGRTVARRSRFMGDDGGRIEIAPLVQDGALGLMVTRSF